MKNKITLCFFLFLLGFSFVSADEFINLTPTPRSMTVGEGRLELPQKFEVSTAGLSEEMAAEVHKFVSAFNAASNYEAQSTEEASALVQVRTASEEMELEAYQIHIGADGILVEASHPAGLYFAFQTIKKLLPPNVMAGVKDESVKSYSLPIVDIKDSPRFEYRGFMLDVSRHFFTIEEVKRVLDVMSYYKMNRFHWHLTDDHGWRVEIKKYPRLTTVGAVSENSYLVDMKHGDYWLNRPYGPFFYTQDQLREVVAYAKERHIEIIPEVDMPGHFCAAMAAYPEFSCTPDGSHAVVSNIGGVYADVLNVANPKAVQFAKDVLSELMDIFPYHYLHIGGDECPTSAWEQNEECIARKNELGLENFRQLQSHFIKDIADFAAEKGRKLVVWNEAITAGGADTKQIVDAGATIMCWVGADGAVSKSASLKLDHIYTPQVPWYINRKQSTDPNEPAGAGNGTDNLEKVYKQGIPVPAGAAAKYFKGVQATFWCEYVGFNDYLEYLMLPRLLAVAEAGWTPQAKRDFEDFCQRVTADSTLFNYNNYSYGKHYMTSQTSNEKVMPNASTETKKHWYRLITRATDTRADKCIELLTDASPLIETYAGKQAQANRLWTNTQANEGDAHFDNQFWAIEEDPNQAGHYALVCKAAPEGSVNGTPTATSTSGRWDYDMTTKHYDFVLADNGYGKDGDAYYYSIRSTSADGVWMNASLGGQGFAVNLYNNPSDGNGGLWKFAPLSGMVDTQTIEPLLNEALLHLQYAQVYEGEEALVGKYGKAETEALRNIAENADPSQMNGEELAAFTESLTQAYRNFRQSFGYLQEGNSYWLGNSVESYRDFAPYDLGEGNKLHYNKETWTDDAWTVVSSQINDDYTQTVTLKNAQTGRFIGTVAQNSTGRIGYLVSIGTQAGNIVCAFQPETQDYVLSIGGKNIYPVPENSVAHPGCISAGSTTSKGNAIRPMGAAWNIRSVSVATRNCYDTDGNYLGTYRHSLGKLNEYPEGVFTPEIKNHQYVRAEEGDRYIYERNAYSVTLTCRDTFGAIIQQEEFSCKVDGQLTLSAPEFKYYELESSDFADGANLSPTRDTTLTAVYSTNAYNGVKQLGKAVTKVEAGKSYVIYDTSPTDTERIGYRNVNKRLQVMKNNQITDTDPNHVWTLEASGKNFKVKNEWHGLYVPQLTTAAQPVTLTADGATYQFILNSDGETWKIKGTNGVCWDGLGSGALVGWNDPGHPYKLYEYYAQPYFELIINAVTEKEELLSTQRMMVKAGDSYSLIADNYEGYEITEIKNAEALKQMDAHTTVTIVYKNTTETSIEAVSSITKSQQKGIYDLGGRKLERISTPGLYIVNGKKIIVR